MSEKSEDSADVAPKPVEPSTFGSADDPPSRGADPPEPAAAKEPATIHIDSKVIIKDSEGDGHTFVGTSIKDQYNYFYSENNSLDEGTDQDSGPRKLDIKHFDIISKARLETFRKEIVVQQQEIDGLLRTSSFQRIFLLEGPPELGKGQIGLKLATELAQRKSIQQVQRSRISLMANTRVDLGDLLKDEKNWKDSLILLDNALRHGNRSLLRLAREMDTVGLNTLEGRLRRLGSYVVLTYDEGQIATFHTSIRTRVHKVTGPSEEQLREFLQKGAEDLCNCEGNPGRQRKLEEFLKSKSQIVAKLKTIPRILRFIQTSLLLVLEGKIALESALEQSDQLDAWLLEQRSADQQELVFALALTLCHAGPPGIPIRWYQFERLRQELDGFLRGELGQEKNPRNVLDLCRDPEILNKLQVEILPDQDGAVIRFIDENRAERLWRCLLGPGRRLCAMAVPLLSRLGDAEEFFLRRQAGWALGRMSQLEPTNIFGRFYNTWAIKVDHPRAAHLTALTSLVQGAVVVGDPHLKTFGIEKLRSSLSDSSFQRIGTGLLALTGLGLIDPRSALDLMKPVFQNILQPCLTRLDRQGKKGPQIETTTFRLIQNHQLRSKISSFYDDAREVELLVELPNAFPEDGELKILMAAQFSLIGLSLSLGTSTVLNELRRWVPAGKAELAPLLAFSFLRAQGMAEVLERNKTVIYKEGDKREYWSPILSSAASNANGEKDLADFLFEIYLGACQLPGIAAKVVTSRWLALIEHWTRQAAEGSEFRDSVVNLWGHLLRAPDLEQREKLGNLLAHPEFGAPGTRLGELVGHIRRGGVLDGMQGSTRDEASPKNKDFEAS
jgi:hypothetical protein